jgi:hypothetical protein
MTWDSFDEAERCEKRHLSAVSVREVEYQFGPYPLRIALGFPDGKEYEYIRDDSFYYYGQEANHANDKDKRFGKRN